MNLSQEERFKAIRDKPYKFWNHVSISEDGCWLWTGGTVSSSGYGELRVNNNPPWNKIGAHRFSYMLHNNVILEPQQLVCHHCDVPLCVRPDHLFVGTNADNAKDKAKKGRAPTIIGNYVLTYEIAEQLRRDREAGSTYKELTKKYKISKGHVSDIVNYKIWTAEVHVGT